MRMTQVSMLVDLLLSNWIPPHVNKANYTLVHLVMFTQACPQPSL